MTKALSERRLCLATGIFILAAFELCVADQDTFAPGTYRAQAPLNAELRVREHSDSRLRVEFISAAADSTGAIAPATCYAVIENSPEAGVLEAPLLPLKAPGFSVSREQLDPDSDRIRLEAREGSIQVTGSIDYCGLRTGVQGPYDPIEPASSRLFQDCPPDPHDCWAEQDSTVDSEDPGTSSTPGGLPEEGVYAARPPANAEMRLRHTPGSGLALEIIAASADGTGAAARPTCFVHLEGRWGPDGMDAPVHPVRAPGYTVTAAQLDNESDRVQITIQPEGLKVAGQTGYCSLNAPFSGLYEQIGPDSSTRFSDCPGGPYPCWTLESTVPADHGPMVQLFLNAPDALVPLARTQRIKAATGQRVVTDDPERGLLRIAGDAGLPGYVVRKFPSSQGEPMVAVQERFDFDMRTVFYRVSDCEWADRSTTVPAYRMQYDYRLADDDSTTVEVYEINGDKPLHALEWSNDEFRLVR